MARRDIQSSRIDRFIGNKILHLRESKGMTRQKLADKINVTYQQLSKYEKAIDRISVSRLVLISKALSKNVSYFFVGLDSLEDPESLDKDSIKKVDSSNIVNNKINFLSKFIIGFKWPKLNIAPKSTVKAQS